MNTTIVRRVAQHLLGRSADEHPAGMGRLTFNRHELYEFHVNLFTSTTVAEGRTVYVVYDMPSRYHTIAEVRYGQRSPNGIYEINDFVMGLHQSSCPTVLGALNQVLTANALAGTAFDNTVYVGKEAAGCLVTVLAAVSPPHVIVTMDMPKFCCDRVFETTRTRVAGRNQRLAYKGYATRPTVVINQL